MAAHDGERRSARRVAGLATRHARPRSRDYPARAARDRHAAAPHLVLAAQQLARPRAGSTSTVRFGSSIASGIPDTNRRTTCSRASRPVVPVQRLTMIEGPGLNFGGWAGGRMLAG